MKLSHSLTVIAILSVFSFAAHAQTSPKSNYVVIGVFRVLDNAIKFTDRANAQSFNAAYAQNPRNKLYYVYLLQSDERKRAITFMMKMRLETEYKEAWVYDGTFGLDGSTPVITKEEPPVVEQPIEETPLVEEEPKADPPVETVVEDSVVQEPPPVTVVEETPKEDSVAAAPATPPPGTRPFYFKLVNAETNNPVVGEVHLVASARGAEQYQSFPVNQIVYLPPPRNAAVYQVSTLAAGYKEMKRIVNYSDPAESAAEVGPNNEYIIALPLVRVKMGDYIEFNNVRFYPNSSIFQPEAKDELDGLVGLMLENKKYKVVVHGHCNGTEDRDIVSKGASTNFFATASNNTHEAGTAKRLSELRAAAVKEYLVAQGVEADRIKTKGEGGSHYIYPSNSTLAARNDRIEVEVKRH